MAKSAILDVLESTIGHYVQNLDAKSLNVAVWAGKIQLDSLQLDIEAVNHDLARRAAEAPNLAIPFRVVEGHFDSLSVDVPWARMTSKPVVLRATGLKVKLEPFDHLATEFAKEVVGQKRSGTGRQQQAELDKVVTKEKEEERIQLVSQADMARKRVKKLRELATEEDDEDEDEGADDSEEQSGGKKEASRNTSSGFKGKLVRRIIENLQLQIDGIQLEIKGDGCTTGFHIAHFSVVTTDQDGNQTFIDRASNSRDVKKSFLYKSLTLKGMGIYCNEEQSRKPFSSSMSPMSKIREEQEASSSYGPNSYIMAPLSFQANLRQSDCIECIDFPKYVLSTELPALSILLTRTQLELLHGMINDVSEKKHVARPLFPEYRPDVPISKGAPAKLWWKYAVRSIGRISRRRSWTEFGIAFHKRKRYIALYKRHAHYAASSWLSPLVIAERIELDQIEKDKSISVQGIMGWRSFADGQVAMERKKYDAIHAQAEANRKSKSGGKGRKSNLMSSFFGSKRSTSDLSSSTTLSSFSSVETDESPPITLTTAEMKELESISFQSTTETEHGVSTNSILCDVKFKLGSFKVDLITFQSQPLASLEMGTVSTGIVANADGSFEVNFALSSLSIHDRITCKTLFPMVIRSLESSSDSKTKSIFQNAFQLKVKKARNGDQHLDVEIVSFEIVASSVLLSELKRFATFTKHDISAINFTPQNPMLKESVTGDADLFYDADEMVGASKMMSFASPKNDIADDFIIPIRRDESSKMSEKLASAFADAWKSKKEKKISWTLELNMHAPILVLPKSCVDPRATVLIVDLGNFKGEYGCAKPFDGVEQWFQSQPSSYDPDFTVDHCSLTMDNLSFRIGTAGQPDWLLSKFESEEQMFTSEAIIEPITLSLHLGVDNSPIARKSTFVTLPSIALNISYSHVVKIVSVTSFWLSFADNLKSADGIDILGAEDSSESNGSRIDSQSINNSVSAKSGLNFASSLIVDYEFFSITLEQFSFKVINDSKENVETHLLSACVSVTKRTDGSSVTKAKMGSFWVLDGLKSNLPRRQRLLVHSNLPNSAERGGPYGNKMDTMSDNAGNDILADITVTKSAHIYHVTDEQSIIIQNTDSEPITKVDAKFSALCINWNPQATRNLLDFKDNIDAFIKKITNTTLKVDDSGSGGIGESPTQRKQATGLLLLKFELKELQICLNSAIDDLPLFFFKMADSCANIHSLKRSDEEHMLCHFTVGDLRIDVPGSGGIIETYCTLLGLAPNHSNSLLSVEVGKGPIAIGSCDLDGVHHQTTDMYTHVKLSPMKFVHIQAHVLTLVEYLTDGILGALARRAMSSAALAALQVDQSEPVPEMVVSVEASGFDFIIPQSAFSTNHFLLHVGDLSILYKNCEAPGKGEASLSLHDVTMLCNQDESVIEIPIRMGITVKLAPHSALSEDDKAMRVEVFISSISLVLARHHYLQIMSTLELNLGEKNTFLRVDPQGPLELNFTEGANKLPEIGEKITHAGVKEFLIEKRIYMAFSFETLKLELRNEVEAIVSLAAVQTSMHLGLLSDLDTTQFNVTMHDLLCEDKREIALNRHFRNIISHDSDLSENDVFNFSYANSKRENSTSMEFILGSPQIVVIPDAILDVASFFQRDGPPAAVSIPPSTKPTSDKSIDKKEDPMRVGSTLQRSSISLKTSNCRLVLIDLGASPLGDEISPSLYRSESAETIVMQGQAEASNEVVKDITTGNTIKFNFELHGERIEAYSAGGNELKYPVQILHPVKCSLFLSLDTKDDKQFIDMSFVTLSNIDVMVSMRDYALVQAILTSMNDMLDSRNTEEIDTRSSSLNEDEMAQIERLARELAKEESGSHTASSTGVEVIFRGDGSTTVTHTQYKERRQKTKIISLKFTLPKSSITIVNDLQGLDEALFRVMMCSCVFGVDLSMGEHSSDLIFHTNLNTSFEADYFDTLSNLWEPLLLKPWQLNFTARRGKKKESRVFTSVDVESDPCRVSFSEQFIASLRGAASMWSIYSGTVSKAMIIIKNEENYDDTPQVKALMKSKASSAARTLTTMMPYGVKNRCGATLQFKVRGAEKKEVAPGGTEYFNFSFPSSSGIGGSRAYGQDSKEKKTLEISIFGQAIYFLDIDEEVNKPKHVHNLGSGRYVYSSVIKAVGVGTIIHLSSFIDFYNQTSLDFDIFMTSKNGPYGVCHCPSSTSISQVNDMDTKTSEAIGIPVPFLQSACYGTQDDIFFTISPSNDDAFRGDIKLPPFDKFIQMGKEKKTWRTFEVSCCSIGDGNIIDKLVVRVCCKVTLVDNCPLVELFLQPRAVLQNSMFVNAAIKTFMPHTRKKYNDDQRQSSGEIIHKLEPFESVEVFTPGNSLAISVKCLDYPTGGALTDWNADGWIPIPLGETRRLEGGRINSLFPFVSNRETASSHYGSSFFVSEMSNLLGEKVIEKERNISDSPDARTLLLSVDNIGVDHTGEVLFDLLDGCTKDRIGLSCFSSSFHNLRITILPSSLEPIRLVQLTMNNEGVRYSLPFSIEDVALCDGGIDSTLINWEGSTSAGYYAYRSLSSYNQAEVHVIPEFVVFNGGNEKVIIKDEKSCDITIEKGKFVPILRNNSKNHVVFTLEFDDGETNSIKINEGGIKVEVVRSKSTGHPMGSIAVQTVAGGKDSRFVIKLGDLKQHVSLEGTEQSRNVLKDDSLRFRIRWSQLTITLLDTSKTATALVPSKAGLGYALQGNDKSNSYSKVAHIILDRFTLDYQKIFKDYEERSQFAIIVHAINISDCTETTERVVLRSASDDTNFLDLCMRTRAASDSGMIPVDLIELKLASDGKKSKSILIDTTEAFLWNLLDLVGRTKVAASKILQTDTEIEFMQSTGTFNIRVVEATSPDRAVFCEDEVYRPPRSDLLLGTKRIRVSPSSFLLSFKREPLTSRYRKVRNVKGAKLVNYFTRKLKFTIDGARLRFDGLDIKNKKGPPDFIVGLITSHYIRQLKARALVILASASIDDWKKLADRRDGAEHYIEGDILRVSGNLTGKTTGYLFNEVGKGINRGLTMGTSEVGKGIQQITESIGAGAVGAGVNSVVSGLGDGVGNTIEGVGEGGGKILKGAGKGVGQIVGGVGGGILLTAKGIGKGVTTGDGAAVVNGLGEGVVSIGSGVIKGTESVVTGAADGVFSLGKGLFSGVKSIGKGIHGGVTGKTQKRQSKRK